MTRRVLAARPRWGAHACLIPALTALIAACNGTSPVSEAPAMGDGAALAALPTMVKGVVQKGPFIRGSSVLVQEVNANLVPAGNSFAVVTTDDLGSFDVPVTLSSQFIEIIASGYYYDELTNQLSAAPLTLRAFADVSKQATVNVNLLTSMAEPLVRTRVGQGFSVSQATSQAESAVLAACGLASRPDASFSALDVARTGAANAALLAASLIVQEYALQRGGSEVANLSQLLSEIGAATDDAGGGSSTLSALQSALCETAASIDGAKVRANLSGYYTSLGATFSIPAFEPLLARVTSACSDASPGDASVCNGSSCSSSDAAVRNDVAPAEAGPPDAAVGDATVTSDAAELDATVTSDAAVLDATVTRDAAGETDGNTREGAVPDGGQTRADGSTPTSPEAGAVVGLAANVFACAVLSSGPVECWGISSSGDLGNGASSPPGPAQCRLVGQSAGAFDQCFTSPVPVSSLTAPTSLAAGLYNGCASVAGGTAECWGSNEVGELGQGTTTGPEQCPVEPCGGSCPQTIACSTTPIAVPGLSHVVAVSAGAHYNCAVLANGTVDCWGAGSSVSDSLSPLQVGGVSNARAIASGPQHSCALLANGTVACWGDNSSDELGNPLLGASSSSTAVPVTGLSGVISIAAGGGHTCALLTGGTVKCWGANASGQLGNGTLVSAAIAAEVSGLSGVAAIASGGGNTCALLTDGTLECWGDNTYGQLGIGSFTGPTSCGTAHLPCAMSPVIVSNLSGATAVVVGLGFACAIPPNGMPKCWGANYLGQLGIGSAIGPESCNGVPCSTLPVAVSF